jgi:nucleoside-diphosphate-sugar epimerase
VRTPRPATDDRAFTLGPDVDPSGLEGVDVLVHCAYDMKLTKRSDIWERNVFGTIRLLDAARAVGVRRTIAVSSMSAYPGTRQLYGRAKLETELAALGRNQVVLRPGLVYGPGWGGMAGTLRKLSALPVLPDFGTPTHQFTVHEDDLAAAFVAVAATDNPPKVPVGIAFPDPVPFRSLLVALATGQGKQAPRFVPTPGVAVLGALRSAELLGAPLPVRADSLLGLLRPAPFVTNVGVLTDLGVHLRPFDGRAGGDATERGGRRDLDLGGCSDR